MNERIKIRANETASCTEFVLDSWKSIAMIAPPDNFMNGCIKSWEKKRGITLNEHEIKCVHTNVKWVYRGINPTPPPADKRVDVEEIGKFRDDPEDHVNPSATKH